jgi:hypothetical protein
MVGGRLRSVQNERASIRISKCTRILFHHFSLVHSFGREEERYGRPGGPRRRRFDLSPYRHT